MKTSAARWARTTFGGVELGDRRLTERLVGIGGAAAACPAGTVTRVMGTVAEKEGAFRFLENRRVDPEVLANALYERSADACEPYPFVYVAVDQTDITVVDRARVRGLGPDCSRTSSALRGAQVMSALALDPQGVVVGLLDQQWWLRAEEKSPDWHHDRRPQHERESWYWRCTMEASVARLQHTSCRPWFICDRGSDVGTFLSRCVELDVLFTVRACQDRIVHDARGRRRKLFAVLAHRPVVGTMTVRVPSRGGLSGRQARCEIRIAPCVKFTLGEEESTLSVVYVRETGRVPRDRDRIEWRLISSITIADLGDAQLVIQSYTRRWKVEEFHRTWKAGGCNVERSQLRSYDALRRWATILAVVAARVERLKQLSRQQPALDALTELSREEVDVAIVLSGTRLFKPGDDLTLQQAVRLIAILGGHMGRKGDGPPGATTIRRGLEHVIPAARAVKALHARCG